MFLVAPLPFVAAQEDDAAKSAAVSAAGEATGPETDTGEMAATPVVEEEVIGRVSPVERLKQGGNTMIFLLALSVAALSFALERLVRLRRGVVAPEGLVDQAQALWEEGKHEEILALCERRPSTLSSIISAFVRHRHCTSQELSMLAGDLAGRDMRRHLQRAYPIAVVATIAPLLGLLGTVVGMIDAFEIVAIAGSLGDASLMAGAISKALVTTATGLVIAIPALGLYHFFKSRTHALTMQLESEVHEILTAWFMDRAQGEGGAHAS
jgi:biopolymer transport protein ExbB